MYNESDNIAVTLERALAVIPGLGFADFEILVIDDGSQDDSAMVVRRAAQREPRIRLLSHPRNLGYGAALRTGFSAARGDVVFYTDSDLPVELSEVARALPLLNDADLVIGYRVRRYDTPRRAVYSKVYNLLMRVLFGVSVRDVNFSFKLVRRRALDAIQLSAATVFIDGQLLAEAVRGGFRIAELPIEYTPRRVGTSSFDSVRSAWVTLVEMLRYRLFPQSLAAEVPRELRPERLPGRLLRTLDPAEATPDLLSTPVPPPIRAEPRVPKVLS
jgi:glycosyltransferase involved in cell wall biosynthesis